ncbi:GGDEF domain-containing protein [Mycolicibacterium komossense]|uniref:GGDEF domain-containing protein n=1 Tax=Mycolicibacterium komossense TaxID=1779 RepID=UPI0021F3B3C6|nr:GGDEF domain-containing protein [Mycolicibacterium komossense]
MTLLKRWWQQPTHYDWLSGYLHARRMSGAARCMMASISLTLSLCLVALLTSADGAVGAVPVGMTWTAFAGGMFGVALWVTRWPTRAQSLAFAVVTNTSIALACLAHPNPLAGLVGCIAFATSGAYIAFFHTSKYVFYNFAVAAGVALYQAIRLARAGHLAMAAVDLFLVLQVNIALPMAITVLIRALGNDLAHADRDPLTGLLNRRAFQQKALGLLLARPAPNMFLLVVVVDLDNFKSLNDRHGHAAGDQALVQVANALRASTRDTAITARSGGEEFIVVDTSYASDPGPLATRICNAIANLPIPVTASIGTACAPLHDAQDGEHQALIDGLVTAADQAMYRAKRFGGNRFHHHGTMN